MMDLKNVIINKKTKKISLDSWEESQYKKEYEENIKNPVNLLYKEFEPAYDNLYTIEIFSSGNQSAKSIADVNKYIKFHATSVNFEGDSLSLSRNSVTKKFQLSPEGSYKRSDNLSITWREADDWRVKKYHEDWISLFYNKENDSYISYDIDDPEKNSLFRTFKIILPLKLSKDPSFSLKNDTKETRLLDNIIVFENVLPSNMGNLNLKWSKNPSNISHTFSYYIENWHWEQSQESNV